MKAILSKMELEDLPNEGLRDLARQIGISKVKEIMFKFGGRVIYIPKTFNKTYYRRYIAKHWDGTNVRKIAEDLGITERTVYRHLDAKLEAR